MGREQLSVDLAIDLYQALLDARRLYLQPALGSAVANVGVIRIDSELQSLVPEPALNHLAQLGLRGEVVNQSGEDWLSFQQKFLAIIDP